MMRFKTLALAAAPVAAVAMLAPQAPAVAQAASPLAQVTAHLKAVNTMVAGFTQTDRKGRSLTGRMTLKRPGKLRFQYQKGVPMLIVADGRKLNMIDYETARVDSWPIGRLAARGHPQPQSGPQQDRQGRPQRHPDAARPGQGQARIRDDHARLRQGLQRARRPAPPGLDGDRRAEQPDDGQAFGPALQRAVSPTAPSPSSARSRPARARPFIAATGMRH